MFVRRWAAMRLPTRLAVVITTVVSLLVIVALTPVGTMALRSVGVGAKASPRAQVPTSTPGLNPPTSTPQLGMGGGGIGGGQAQPCSQLASNSSGPYATYVAPPYATYTPPAYATYTPPPYSTYVPPAYATYTPPPYSTYVPPSYATYTPPPAATAPC